MLLKFSFFVMALIVSTSALALPTVSTASTSTLSLPLQQLGTANTGPTALPTPTSNPIVIALGVGHQNYTCNNITEQYVQNVPSSGALARLYNVTKLLEQHPGDVESLPTIAYQLEFLGLKRRCAKERDSDWASFILGLHYFDDAHRPTFNLTNAEPPAVLSAAKKGAVKAPAAGDIDWLYLADANDGISQGGVKSVYRVETVGGVAPLSCDAPAPAMISVPYAAEYWFYGEVYTS